MSFQVPVTSRNLNCKIDNYFWHFLIYWTQFFRYYNKLWQGSLTCYIYSIEHTCRLCKSIVVTEFILITNCYSSSNSSIFSYLAKVCCGVGLVRPLYVAVVVSRPGIALWCTVRVHCLYMMAVHWLSASLQVVLVPQKPAAF